MIFGFVLSACDFLFPPSHKHATSNRAMHHERTGPLVGRVGRGGVLPSDETPFIILKVAQFLYRSSLEHSRPPLVNEI